MSKKKGRQTDSATPAAPKAQPPGEQPAAAESHVLVVESADPARGIFTVTWADGRALRLYLPPSHADWQGLGVGARMEVTRAAAGKGGARYTYRLAEPRPTRSAARERATQPIDPPPHRRRDETAQGAPDDAPPWELDEAPPVYDTRRSAARPEPARPGGEKAEIDLEQPVRCPPLDSVFAPRGPVAQLLGNRYRPREGQIEMANLVRDALRDRRHAIIEAGTGIGKSFAYLIPIIWSHTQAVVSTSNKALMNQLWEKDLPALQRIAPQPFTIALLKGRSNYVCARKVEHNRRQRHLPGIGRDQEALARGLARAPAGDVELMRLPADLAAHVTVGQHECEGTHCPLFGECFYERAKAQAAQSDIIVTNHALLCYSTLFCENKILPLRPVLVIDEAHELERYAINALTQTLEHGTTLRVVSHSLSRAALPEDERRQTMECNQAFFEEVARQRQSPQTRKWGLQGEIQEGLRLWQALNALRSQLEKLKPGEGLQGQLDALIQFADETIAALWRLSEPESEQAVRFCEISDDGPLQGFEAFQVCHQPLEVADTLSTGLFEAWPRVICTSATLGVHDGLAWQGRRLGAPMDERTITGVIPSPFNYREHVLLYTPAGIIPAYGPQEEPYVARLAAEVQRLIEVSRGRAFVLCTSRRRMDQLFDRLAPALPYPCFCQGRGNSRVELLERFLGNPGAVLFGTRSFWEGVDIPGDALSLVILDKIPFLPQDDPVLARQEKRVEARGGIPFQELQLGQAILTLRQGAGRLVRSETDRGVIALLDSRVITSRYGQQILRALPDGRNVRSFEEVRRFFGTPAAAT